MGKKVERALTRDKGQTSASSHDQEEDPNKPPEPYVCTGRFHDDFAELCRRAEMIVPPPVVARPRRPGSPPPVIHDEPKAKTKGADKKKQAQEAAPEPEAEQELDENGEPPEPPPKTYAIRDKFELFKPCVQVEMEHPDKQDTVTEVFVRGWRVDVTFMNIFKDCWKTMEKLQTINFWSVGLTDETLEILSSCLQDIPNLKTLNLDNNPVKEERFDLLLKEDSPVQHLSLRYNGISAVGARHLAAVLGDRQRANPRLLSLNLNGNRVGDDGACVLFDSLRMNRTLLSLGLAGNGIGDAGAKKVAEVLSKFPLTHEELVERRKLMAGKESHERKSVSPPPGSRRADSRDRPGSVKSKHGDVGKGGKSAKNKKDGKGGKDEKETKGKGGKEEKDTKGGKKASMANESKAGEKGGKGKKGKGKNQQPDAEAEGPEASNALADQAESVNGIVFLAGNRCLINLNLSGNLITEEGMKALVLAISYQTTLTAFPGRQNAMGLMRLSVQRNKVAKDNETLLKLNSQMLQKDPFYKPAPTPDAESQASKS